MTRPADFSQMAFRHDWRDYQARLLAEMDDHITDKKLHFVAAPGAGKTVLGLEIIRRLGQRTLVLAPSLLVRDQWMSRLVEGYLGGRRPDWISTDLASNAPLRFSTYQNVHTNRAGDIPPFAVLCLDEAHHLRRSWWRTLMRLSDRDAPVTLSLTATPPYDVEPAEWRNYMALCGPVDAEISVPELVRSGDLCPHQYLIYLSPAADRAAYLDNQASEAALFQALAEDAEIVAALRQHPWITATETQSHDILGAPARFSAMLVYLRHNGVAPPAYARRVLQVNDADWPALDWGWLREVLDSYPLAQLPEAVLRRLRRAGALRDDRLTLPPPGFADRIALLKNDKAKLEAVAEILAVEAASRGAELRMAVLLDRIGRSELRLAAAPVAFNAMGLFRHVLPLVGDRIGGERIAVLTGQIALLPEAACDGLESDPLPGAPGFRIIDGPDHGAAVARANRLFETGEIRIIIGTHAFLGQGWDAPALNTLVLGTRLKSFVAVNQLRGRALRTFRARPDKVSNIWHMAVVPDSRTEGEDVARLRQRFECFVRLDREEGAIHSDFGIAEGVAEQNAQARQQAAEAGTLAAEWRDALLGRGDFQARLVTQTGLPAAARAQFLPLPALSLWARMGRLWGRQASRRETRKIITRMARMVMASLAELGDLPPPDAEFAPIVAPEGQSWRVGVAARCKLDEAIFHEAFQQVFNPVDNPRYVITVESGLFHPSFQYFAVPDRFGSHKDRAAVFWRNWQGHVGRGTLVYTRTVAGRAVLQAARLSTTGRRTNTRTRWQ